MIEIAPRVGFRVGSLQLGLRDARRWCGPTLVRLPPKPSVVLSCLVTQGGIARQELRVMVEEELPDVVQV